jgi:hypothetical protein
MSDNSANFIRTTYGGYTSDQYFSINGANDKLYVSYSRRPMGVYDADTGYVINDSFITATTSGSFFINNNILYMIPKNGGFRFSSQTISTYDASNGQVIDPSFINVVFDSPIYNRSLSIALYDNIIYVTIPKDETNPVIIRYKHMICPVIF